MTGLIVGDRKEKIIVLLLRKKELRIEKAFLLDCSDDFDKEKFTILSSQFLICGAISETLNCPYVFKSAHKYDYYPIEKIA